jgi:oxygen-independent coproporphyrinogen-3 oxidase
MPEMLVSLTHPMAGIYIHIPFCKQACHYCDFHFSTNTTLREKLVDSLIAELRMQRLYLKGESIQTLYFGGGTPSLLPAGELSGLIQCVNEVFSLAPNAEITLEANPDDMSPAYLEALRELGINRLSVGIQSFDDRVLNFLNRAHSASSAVSAVAHAREAGFENISIDLIFAIPDMTNDEWITNIQKALALQPDHISAYSLTIEPKTVFGNWSRNGRLHPVDDTLAAGQLEMLMDELVAAGFRQYEISNFARPGYESRHNSSYWKGTHYLGIGPGAHSFDGESRQANVRNNHLYIKEIDQGRIPADREMLSREDKINEYILTALRTDKGIDLSWLRTHLGYDLGREHAAYLADLRTRQLIATEDDRLILLRRGKLVADQIAGDLFLVP